MTHEPGFARGAADRVIVLADGPIVEQAGHDFAAVTCARIQHLRARAAAPFGDSA